MTLEIRSLTKRFPGKRLPAVDGLSMDVRDGEILGFVGLNGAGKTTTIRTCAGVILPTSGSVAVDGKDIVAEKAAASRQMGWVSEFPNFDPGARSIDILTYLAGYYGLSGSAAEKRCSHLLEVVGLPDMERVRFRAFSQGMKKRFGIARALLGDPQNLLLDEVLNGLDPEGVHFVRELVIDLRHQGMAVLLSSHILAELQTVADRFAIIHKGKLVRVLTRPELDKAGSSRLRVCVQNADEKLDSVVADFGKVERSGSTVWVSGSMLPPEQVCDLLVKGGYRLSELVAEKEGLEAVFLRLIGHGAAGSETGGL